jgi:hypothetical protein
MSQLIANTAAFIHAQQYSNFILENMDDVLLPEGFYRDVSDFGSGTTLNIKTVGTVTLQDAAEDVPLNFNPIDTGTITLSITDYVGDAWRVTDDLREDGSQIDLEHVSNRIFKKAIATAQVKAIKFHNLRSTFAANFCMNGGDVYTLSKILNHSTVEMTSQKYAHLHPN